MVAGKIARRLIMANEGFATSSWMCRNIKSHCLIAMNLPFIFSRRQSFLSFGPYPSCQRR
jgi:hypothetical protein